MRRGMEDGQSAGTGPYGGQGALAQVPAHLQGGSGNRIIDHGKPMRPYGGNDPQGRRLTVRAVALDTVRFEFVAAYPAEGGDAKAKRDAKQKAFKRALEQARERELIGSREIGGIDYLWLVEAAPKGGDV